MLQKSKARVVAWVGFLLIMFGLGFYLSRSMGVGAAVLGLAVGEEGAVAKVLRIVRDQEAAVIVPKASVHQAGSENYVLVVEDGVSAPKSVEAQVWRERYVKITAGLENEDLVILDSQIALGRAVSFEVVNPEAGQSGVVGN